MTSAAGEGEAELLAPTAELALFVGGAVLTLLVIGFVTALVITIIREERAAARAGSSGSDGGSAVVDPADEQGGDR